MNLTPLTPSPPSAVRPSSSTSTNTSTSVPRRRRRPFNCPRELHDVDEVCNVRLDKLQQDGFPHKSLPLDVKITSTSVEQHHVVYHVTVSSRTTKDSWVVSYRYRQFLYLKSRVEDTHSCRSSKCTGSCVAIRSILEALFPRQRLISSAFPYIVTKRARAFENVLRYLLGCVLLPGSAMKCTEARGGLTLVLFQFLRVVDPLNQRTLLQTYVDNRSHHNDATSTPTAAAASECIICLEDLSQTNSDSTESPGVVRLSCHHAFHRDCLLEWLLVETHCPMCRSSVVPKAVAQYCVVQAKAHFDGRLQGTTVSQWWLEDFAEDPLK